MRIVFLFALVLTACSQEAPAPSATTPEFPPGIFASGDRDAMCILGIGKGQRAGFVIYGAGDTNCSASGKISQVEGQWILQPSGDSECRIPLAVTKDGIAIRAAPAACSYYCAPGVSFAGRAFTRVGHSMSRPSDLAGDPLC